MRNKLIYLAMSLALDLPAVHAAGTASPDAGIPVQDAMKQASSARTGPAGELLVRARQWEAKGRDDLAAAALNKARLIAPDNPEVLEAMGVLDVRTGHLPDARKALERLRRVAPNHPAITRIEDLLRLAGPDRDKLRQARLLASSGRKAEALEKFRTLYPNGPPDGDLALEFWKLVADTPQGFEPARRGLAKLVGANPDNLRYRIAFARLETSRLPLNRQALNTLIDLSRMPDYAREAKAAWRNALLQLGNDASNIPLLKAYLEQDPGDSAIAQQLEATIKARDAALKSAEEKRRLEADPYYQAERAGIASLDSGDLEGAQQRLNYALSGRPNDADAVGAMGLLRFKQGYDFEAQAYFLRARQLDPSRDDKWIPLLDASRFWGFMKEYGDAEKAGEAALAEAKLRNALAIKPDQPDALAALGHILYARGDMRDAEKAYRQAMARQTTNSSALGGLITLYLKTDRSGNARQLLANLSDKQKKALGDTFNSLKSGMLRQEAAEFDARGDRANAVRALEEAVAIDPDDPWLRFNLAQLYIKGGDRAKVQPLFDAYLSKHADDAAGHYALALLQSSMDEDEKALSTLDKIAESGRDAKILALRQRILFGMHAKQAKALALSGEKDKAAKILTQMQHDAQGDIGLTTQTAYAWADMGETARAREILEKLEASPTPLTTQWHLRYANFLDGIDAQDALARELATIGAMKNLAPDELRSLNALKESAAIASGEALRKAGKLDEAQLVLAPYLMANSKGARLLLEEAKIAIDANRPKTAEADYRRILATDPDNADALKGLISLYLKSGRMTDAKTMLAALTGKQRQSLGKSFNSLKSGILRQEAEKLDAAGDQGGATRDLMDAIALDPDDPWLRFDLAKRYLKNGDRARGQALFDDYFREHPDDPTGLYAFALLQSSADEDENAIATLDRIPEIDRSEKILRFRDELNETIAIRKSDALRRSGKFREADGALSPLLAANANSPRLLLARARIYMDEKNPQSAEADYRHILARDPVDGSAREGLVDALVDEGHLLMALNQVHAWLSATATHDTQTRLEEVGILIKLEDYPTASKKLSEVLALEPGNKAAQAYANRIAAHGNPAFQPYTVASLMEHDESLPSWLRRQDNAAPKSTRLSKSEARAADETVSWLSTAADIRTRSGTPGQSQFSSVEIPLEYKTPLKSGGQIFLRTDAVRVDAGTLNANSPDAKSFGTLLLCQPNCPASNVSQQANGASFTVGFNQGRDLRLDMGTTPLGFPVRHLVGGILKRGDLGPFSYSADFSRRLVTSTVLSYAGTRDPRTGLTWGGVVATGPRLGLSLDNGGAFGAWSTFEIQNLTGENVQSNVRKRLMAGGYWRAINEDDMELSIGLTGMLWKYTVDAGEFSYGQGGYYSPQHYESLSFPVSFGQRISNFSYVLRASVSTSYSRFDASPYYPTDQALQAQGNTYYNASSGPGSGYSLLADWEYLLTPGLYLGGQFDLQRSVYYSPNHFLIYLRHPIGGMGAQQVFLPPRLFEPTSQF